MENANDITELVITRIFKAPPARDGHRDGWSSSFDKLAEYLEGATA